MTTATAPTVAGLAQLHAIGADLAAHDRWTRPQLLDFQRRRLRELVDHAVAHSPYYREALGAEAARGEVRLERLPTLPKATLVEQFDRIVTDPRLRLADLEEHLRRDPGGRYLDRYRIFATSGSSGLRALITYSDDEFRYWVGVSLRLFSRIGLTPEMRLVAIGAPNPLHITRQLFAAFRSGRSGTPELSVETPVDEIVAALNAYQPDALLGYASIAGLLAQEQLEGRLQIAPRVVGVSSEVLTAEARRWIEQAWSVRPNEVYATTETLFIACSTPPHAGMHVFEDLCVVEVVDERGRPVPPGQPGHKVLVTNLVNRTQPLIRYELSDSVTLPAGLDSIGLPYRRIASVDGRSDDILRFPSPARGMVAVHPYRLRQPFAAFDDIRQYQILQHRDTLEVRVVLQPSATPRTPTRVEAALAATLSLAGAAPVPIHVVPVQAIEREGGHAAKIKLVKKVDAL